MPQRTVSRFRAWTSLIGGVLAAELLNTSPANVSHIRAGRRRPGLDVAVRLERVTRGWEHGPIRVHEWVQEQGEALPAH